MSETLDTRVALLEQIARTTHDTLLEIRSDIREMRTEMRGEIKAVRTDLGDEIKAVRGEIGGLRSQMFTLFLALLGVVLAGYGAAVLAILGRVFGWFGLK